MTAIAAQPSSPSPAQPDSDAIRTDRLSRRFGKLDAVADVTLVLPRGRTYGLIGLNGAGKSTLIRMMMGLIPPTSGSAHVRGVDVWRDRINSKVGVGYVPDRPTAYPWMRVEEAIAFCRSLQPKWNDAYAADLLKRFRLDPRQRAGKLSKGQGAKLSLLLALAHDPEVLILDEPTDGLDPVARDDFLEGVLAAACEHERSVLISSHALDEVQRLTDTIGLMHAGRLVIQRSTEELVRSTKRVRVVVPDDAPALHPPAGTIYERRDGRQWAVTIGDFSDAAFESVRAAAGTGAIVVEDLRLDDIFKDFVRGQERRP